MNAQREKEIREIGAWTSIQRENPLKVRDELIEEIDRLRKSLSEIRNTTILWRREHALEVLQKVHAIACSALEPE